MVEPEYEKLLKKLKAESVSDKSPGMPIGYVTPLREAIADLSEAIYALNDRLIPFLSAPLDNNTTPPKMLPDNCSLYQRSILELTDTVTTMTYRVLELKERIEWP